MAISYFRPRVDLDLGGVELAASALALASSWWRATNGVDDADRLAFELFEGRLALARRFATTHVPVAPPSGIRPGRRPILERWWLDTSFEPRLPAR